MVEVTVFSFVSNINNTFSDPVSWYIGDPVPRWNISGPGADLPNGLIVSLNTAVTHPVIVHAWELNANKSGSLDIVVIMMFLTNISSTSLIHNYETLKMRLTNSLR